MTDLIEIKTSDLTGEALNWSVAKALGLNVYLAEPQYGNLHRVMVRYTPDGCHFEQVKRFKPSTDWVEGGPLIEKYRISLIYAFEEYEALIGMTHSQSNESPLIAACQAIVASVLGDTVSVPKELLS